MSHEFYLHRLPDHVKGQLPQEEEAAVTRHLNECASCRSLETRLRSAMVLLGEERPAVPANYFSTILPRFRQRLDQKGGFLDLGNPLLERILIPLTALTIVVSLVAVVMVDMKKTQNGSELQAVLSSMTSEDLADVLLEQSTRESLTASLPTDAMATAVPEGLITEQLVSTVLDDEQMMSLQAISDLDDREIDLLVQRLGERKML